MPEAEARPEAAGSVRASRGVQGDGAVDVGRHDDGGGAGDADLRGRCRTVSRIGDGRPPVTWRRRAAPGRAGSSTRHRAAAGRLSPGLRGHFWGVHGAHVCAHEAATAHDFQGVCGLGPSLLGIPWHPEVRRHSTWPGQVSGNDRRGVYYRRRNRGTVVRPAVHARAVLPGSALPCPDSMSRSALTRTTGRGAQDAGWCRGVCRTLRIEALEPAHHKFGDVRRADRRSDQSAFPVHATAAHAAHVDRRMSGGSARGSARSRAEHPRRQGQAPGTPPRVTGVTAGQHARPRDRRLRAGRSAPVPRVRAGRNARRGTSAP